MTIRFAWWGSADRAKTTEAAVDLFEKKYSNITVQTSYSAFAPYFQKLATETAGNNAPDVLQMDRAYLREYADRGTLLELDKKLKDALAPAVADSGVVDGKVYALPMGQNTHVIVYDAEAFAKAGLKAPAKGWTWDDLRTGAAKLTAASGGKISGTTDLGWSWEAFEVWLRQQDKELYDKEGKFGFDKSDLKTFLELLKTLRDEKASTPPNVTTQIDGAIENMPMGKKLSYSENSWDSTVASYYKVLGKPVALAPFPSDTDKLGQYAKPSMYVSISKRTKHKDAARKLVDFLLNDVEAGKVMGTDRGLPPNLKVREAVAADLSGARKAVYDYEASLVDSLDKAPTAPPKGNSAIKTYWQQLNDEIAFKKISIDDAVEQFLSRGKQELSS